MRLDNHARAFAGVCLLMVVSYGPLASAGFVFDDFPLIVNNTLIRDLGNLGTFFRTDLWAGADMTVNSGYFRPLVVTSFAVDHALFGDWAGGYHLQSLAWHLVAALLFFALLRRMFSPEASLVGASLFALHPLQSEAVAWIAARNDVMVAAFCLAALLALDGPRPRPRALALGALLWLCALLSKESAVLLPAVVLGLDVLRDRRLSHWSKLASMGAAFLVYGLIRANAHLTPEDGPTVDILLGALSSTPQLVGHYGMRVLSPYPLSIGGSLEYLHDWTAIASLAVLGVCGLLVWRGGRKAALGIAWAFLFFAPAVLAISFRAQLGERYMYLPLAGLGVALAAVTPSDRRAWYLVGGLCVLHLAVVPMRIRDWTNDQTLWQAAVQSDPNGYTYAGVAHTYVEQGEIEAGARYLHLALEEDPPYVEFCDKAILLGLRHERLDLAYRGAYLVGQNCPDTPDLLGLVGTARMMAGDIDGVRSVLNRWDGQPEPRLDQLAAAMALFEERPQDVEPYRARADDPEAFTQRVELLARLGREREGDHALRESLRQAPVWEHP